MYRIIWVIYENIDFWVLFCIFLVAFFSVGFWNLCFLYVFGMILMFFESWELFVGLMTMREFVRKVGYSGVCNDVVIFYMLLKYLSLVLLFGV